MKSRDEEKYNKIAHANCIKKLNNANERIVEFEDIKKLHLKTINGLREALDEIKTDLELDEEWADTRWILEQCDKALAE